MDYTIAGIDFTAMADLSKLSTNAGLKETKMNVGFDDWAADQEVEYTLIAKVNDEVAYKQDFGQSDDLIGQVRHAEEQVAQLLNEQYSEPPEYQKEI